MMDVCVGGGGGGGQHAITILVAKLFNHVPSIVVIYCHFYL